MLRAVTAHLDAMIVSVDAATEALRRHNLEAARSAALASAASGPSGATLDEDIRRGRSSATLATLRRRVPTPRR